MLESRTLFQSNASTKKRYSVSCVVCVGWDRVVVVVVVWYVNLPDVLGAMVKKKKRKEKKLLQPVIYSHNKKKSIFGSLLWEVI